MENCAMAVPLASDDLVLPVLLVKAVLAGLAAVLFLYYRHHWQKAKRHMPVHFFFTKWRAVSHAFMLGFAAVGFMLGFTLELIGTKLGLGPTAARLLSSVFEIGSLFCMLYVFFTLTLEDVPHFQHLYETAWHRKHNGNGQSQSAMAQTEKKNGKKRKRKKSR
jgi:hypothetical protein